MSIVQDEIQVEEKEKPAVKRQKQIFHRAIKRNYQRQDHYQKTR